MTFTNAGNWQGQGRMTEWREFAFQVISRAHNACALAGSFRQAIASGQRDNGYKTSQKRRESSRRNGSLTPELALRLVVDLPLDQSCQRAESTVSLESRAEVFQPRSDAGTVHRA